MCEYNCALEAIWMTVDPADEEKLVSVCTKHYNAIREKVLGLRKETE